MRFERFEDRTEIIFPANEFGICVDAIRHRVLRRVLEREEQSPTDLHILQAYKDGFASASDNRLILDTTRLQVVAEAFEEYAASVNSPSWADIRRKEIASELGRQVRQAYSDQLPEIFAEQLANVNDLTGIDF